MLSTEITIVNCPIDLSHIKEVGVEVSEHVIRKWKCPHWNTNIITRFHNLHFKLNLKTVSHD